MRIDKGLSVSVTTPAGSCAGEQEEQQRRQQSQQQEPICTITITPATPEKRPHMRRPLRIQSEDFVSFLQPKQPAVQKRAGLFLSNNKRSSTRRNPRVSVTSVVPEGTPGAPVKTAPTTSSTSIYRSPRARRPRTESLNPPDDANRRVRFWCSTGPPPRAGSSVSLQGVEPHVSSDGRRPQKLALAAAALGGPSSSTGKRSLVGERGQSKVTFASAGLRPPLSTRRSCIPSMKAGHGQLAPTTPADSVCAAAGTPLTAVQQKCPQASLDRSSWVEEVGGQWPSRASAGRNPKSLLKNAQQQQQQSLLPHQQVTNGEAPSSERPHASVRRQSLVLADESTDQLAAETVSLAATRAAAVAKAAAAVAAAAQAEVEAAAAAAAAWGNSEELAGRSSSSLSTEHRRELLMLVLRLLLLLPAELQRAIQARLFMLQQQRCPGRSPFPWTKRAATTANLHMTLGASGPLSAPWRSPQQPHKESASPESSSAAAPAYPPRPDAPNSSNSFVDSTVNGLFLSATLQASAVLQMTPGRAVTEHKTGGSPVAAGAGAAPSPPVSCRLSTCRCGSASVGGTSFQLQERGSMQQQRPPASQQQHSEVLPTADGRGPLGCSSVVHPPSSCCHIHRTTTNQKGEPPWTADCAAVSQGALPGPPSLWTESFRGRTGATVATSCSTFCCCSCSYGGPTRQPPSWQHTGAAAGGFRMPRMTSQLACSHRRILLTAGSAMGPSKALALPPPTDNSSVGSGTSNTDSSRTATSHSTSDSNSGKEAQAGAALSLEGAVKNGSVQAEEEPPPGDSSHGNQVDAAVAAAIARVAAAAAVERRNSSLPRIRAADVSGEQLPVLLSREAVEPPFEPPIDTEHCSSSRGCLSLASTVGRAASPKGDLGQPGDSLVTGDLCCGPPQTQTRQAAPNLPHSSLVNELPPLPDTDPLSSCHSLERDPTSMFFGANDPRRYVGPLVKSSAISVEALPAAVVLPPLRGVPRKSPSRGSRHLLSSSLAQHGALPVNATPTARLKAPPVREKQKQRQPRSCPNLQLPEAAISGHSWEGLFCGVTWRPEGSTGVLETEKWTKTVVSLSCSLPTSCICRRASLILKSPQQGHSIAGPIFTEEPLQCALPPSPLPSGASSPEACSSRVASPRRGTHSLPVQDGERRVPSPNESPNKGHGVFLEALSGRFEVSAAKFETRSAAERPDDSGGHGQRPEEPAGASDPSGSSQESRLFEGIDWRSSPTAAAFNTYACRLLKHPPSCKPPISFEAVLRALEAMGDGVCTAESRKAAAFLMALIILGDRDKSPNLSKKQGSLDVPPKGARASLLSEPTRLFDFCGLDMEHALPGGPADVLRVAFEAQQRRLWQHQEELYKLYATMSRPSNALPSLHFPSVIALHAEALQRMCHSALQRALKASRAVAALQLADEKRVHLLCEYESELTRLCSAVETVQFRLSTSGQDATRVSEKKFSGSVTVSLAAEPCRMELSRSGPSPESSERTATVENIAGLPSVPELLLLGQPSCLRRQVSMLRQLEEAARTARRGEYDFTSLHPHFSDIGPEQQRGTQGSSHIPPLALQLTGVSEFHCMLLKVIDSSSW